MMQMDELFPVSFNGYKRLIKTSNHHWACQVMEILVCTLQPVGVIFDLSNTLNTNSNQIVHM